MGGLEILKNLNLTYPYMSSNRTEIIVAFIGSVVVIGSAIFSNWDKLSPPQIVATPTPIVPTPSLESLYAPEVKSVIQRSMIVGNQAYWDLDSSLLDEVFTENALKLLQDSIRQYISLGRKIDSQSQGIKYVDISFTDQPLRAKVKFTRSHRVYAYSLQTDQCVEATPEYQQKLTYDLQHQTNGWKIFAIDLHTKTPDERLPCQ
jgi:hypothetical protein